MQQEINEALSNFGLLPNEQAVYLALLSSGPNTITPLGRSLHLPITTVQSIANRLHERGLVNITKNKSRHVYSALDPAVLRKSSRNVYTKSVQLSPFSKPLNLVVATPPKYLCTTANVWLIFCIPL